MAVVDHPDRPVEDQRVAFPEDQADEHRQEEVRTGPRLVAAAASERAAADRVVHSIPGEESLLRKDSALLVGATLLAYVHRALEVAASAFAEEAASVVETSSFLGQEERRSVQVHGVEAGESEADLAAGRARMSSEAVVRTCPEDRLEGLASAVDLEKAGDQRFQAEVGEEGSDRCLAWVSQVLMAALSSGRVR